MPMSGYLSSSTPDLQTYDIFFAQYVLHLHDSFHCSLLQMRKETKLAKSLDDTKIGDKLNPAR